MAESAVQDADVSVDQLNPMPNVAKIHGSDTSKILPNAATSVKSNTGKLGGYEKPIVAQGAGNWTNIWAGKLDNGLTQANVSFKVTDLSAEIGKNGSSNVTFGDEIANEAIRDFFAAQKKATQKSQGTLRSLTISYSSNAVFQ